MLLIRFIRNEHENTLALFIAGEVKMLEKLRALSACCFQKMRKFKVKDVEGLTINFEG